jgi:asparagine synthase (glutamine-hydrolysing)
MSRLKIVDQHDLSVPFRYDYLDVVLAYNGEVYNHQELRTELSDGTPWLTTCDAEVLARAWRAWGPECLSRFNGMWGLVLIDTLADEVFVARDRAGQKPLFYAPRGDKLYIASEAKALGCELVEGPCLDREAFEFDFGEQTPFEGVKRLEGGCCLQLAGPGGPHPRRWWSLPQAQCSQARYPDAVEQLEALIIDSVKLRTTAEVPVALQLSGGLDSAIIHGALQRNGGAGDIRKYCMDFTSEGINNISTARLVDPDVQEVRLTLQELQQILPKVAYHLDTPATWSALCLWKLAERIYTDGGRIVLSGEGADELFGGYTRYRILFWLQEMFADVKLGNYAPTIQTFLGGGLDAALARLLDRSPSSTHLPYTRDLIGRYWQSPHLSALPAPVRACMRVEWHTTMQVLLRMGDRMATAWELENRCPFLDYRIVEFACALPAKWLITRDESKRILRDVAHALGVPAEIISEQTKRGLAVPWAKWAKQLGLPLSGHRGDWDRSAFSAMMLDAWRENCLRPALEPAG